MTFSPAKIYLPSSSSSSSSCFHPKPALRILSMEIDIDDSFIVDILS